VPSYRRQVGRTINISIDMGNLLAGEDTHIEPMAGRRSAGGFSKLDATMVRWSSGGEQAKCDAFRADGDGATVIWYLSRALNDVLKDTPRESTGGSSRSWEHVARLQHAARSIRCSSVGRQRVVSRSRVVSAPRQDTYRLVIHRVDAHAIAMPAVSVGR